MLLIKKAVILALFVLSVSAIIITAVAAYSLIGNSAGMSAADMAFQAERILFAGILVGTVTSLAFTAVMLRSRNIKKDIDRLIRQNKLTPEATGDGLLRFGETGQKLNILYRQIDEISQKRGLMISALNRTAEFLSQHISESIIILDVTGRVVQVSRGYLDDHDTGRADIIDRVFEVFSDEILIKTILSRLEKRHLPIETEINKVFFRWVPIYNKENEISYIAAIQLEA